MGPVSGSTSHSTVSANEPSDEMLREAAQTILEGFPVPPRYLPGLARLALAELERRATSE